MKTVSFKRKALGLSLAVLFALSLMPTASADALSITSNEFVPFVLIVAVPCANGGSGELVLLDGTLHIQNHVTINGKRVNLKTHDQPQDVSGLGLATGDTYHAVGVTQEQDSLPITNGAAEFTFVNNFRIIGTGPGNNLQVHQVVHTTVNANGDVTSEIIKTSIDCN
jgi:hypothetical protein